MEFGTLFLKFGLMLKAGAMAYQLLGWLFLLGLIARQMAQVDSNSNLPPKT